MAELAAWYAKYAELFAVNLQLCFTFKRSALAKCSKRIYIVARSNVKFTAGFVARAAVRLDICIITILRRSLYLV